MMRSIRKGLTLALALATPSCSSTIPPLTPSTKAQEAREISLPALHLEVSERSNGLRQGGERQDSERRRPGGGGRPGWRGDRDRWSAGPWIPPPDGYLYDQPYSDYYSGYNYPNNNYPSTYYPGNYPQYPVSISYFDASPTQIYRGDSVTLTWSVSGASSVAIDGVGGGLPSSGTQIISPTYSSIYTLRAYDTWGGEGASRSVQINVVERQPMVTGFWADRTQLKPYESTVLHVIATGCVQVQITSSGDGRVSGTYSCVADIPVAPQKTTTYSVRVVGGSGQVVDSTPVTITVNLPPEKPVIENLYVTPSTINLGESAELRWSVKGASRIEITGYPGQPPNSGAMTIKPQNTVTYVLRAFGTSGGVSEAKATVTVNSPAPPPTIDALNATPAQVLPNQTVQLSWRARDCVHAEILEDHLRPVPCEGSLEDRPVRTKSYTLRVYGSKGDVDSRIVTVQVAAPAIVPTVNQFSVTSMDILRGQSTTIQWSVGHASRVEFVGVNLKNPPLTGQYTISPKKSKVIRLNAYDDKGQVATSIVHIHVRAPERPSIGYFTGGNGSAIAVRGQPYRLSWSVRNCAKIEITGISSQDLPQESSIDFVPQGDQTVTIRGYGYDGTVVESTLKIVTIAPNPSNQDLTDALLRLMGGFGT